MSMQSRASTIKRPTKRGILELYAQAMSPSDPVHLAGVTSPEPRARAQWGSLSREQIVAAAIATIEMGHYESMTIRSLASELGVAPMTLYRHIRDRDDLLDEVANQLLEKSWRPTEVHETWQEWISEAAMRLRNLLVAQARSAPRLLESSCRDAGRGGTDGVHAESASCGRS